MQICRYKLENNTLNSVLDCDSNKTITEKIGWKGPKLYSAKGTVWFSHDTLSYIVSLFVCILWFKYGMASLHWSSMASLYFMAILHCSSM
jgi:hypothetical protein